MHGDTYTVRMFSQWLGSRKRTIMRDRRVCYSCPCSIPIPNALAITAVSARTFKSIRNVNQDEKIPIYMGKSLTTDIEK